MVACGAGSESDDVSAVDRGTSPGEATEPAEWVVFGSGRSGDGDILAVNPETGRIRPLVTTPAPEGAVRWDPARRRIVHHRFDADAAVLVSGGRDLFVDPNGDVAPAWSPDGNVVYALEADGAGDLWVADSLGENPRRLTADAAVERYPSWSPGGDRIVYAKRLEAGWDLFVLTLETGEEERITADGAYVGHPAWSPDGRWIAYDTFFGDQTEIVVRDLETGDARRVTNRERNDLIPSWSCDGSRLVFGWETEPGNFDVWMAELESGELVRLTSDPGPDGGPIFVPAEALSGS